MLNKAAFVEKAPKVSCPPRLLSLNRRMLNCALFQSFLPFSRPPKRTLKHFSATRATERVFRGAIFGPVRKCIKHEVGRVDFQSHGVLHQIVEPGRLAARFTNLAVLHHDSAGDNDRGIFLYKEPAPITKSHEICGRSKKHM